MDWIQVAVLGLITMFTISVSVIAIVIIEKRKNRKLVEEVESEKLKYDKLLNQKKSSEVRLGKIGENMAPFVKDWPFDPNNFRFLGNPIDGIQFSDDEIIFMEIKTGKARLTQSQLQVKKLVGEGKVRFATFRIGDSGCVLKVE